MDSSISTYLDVVRACSPPAPGRPSGAEVSAHAEVLAAVRDGDHDLAALRARLPQRSLGSLLGSLGWLAQAKLVDVDLRELGLSMRLTPLAVVELLAKPREL